MRVQVCEVRASLRNASMSPHVNISVNRTLPPMAPMTVSSSTTRTPKLSARNAQNSSYVRPTRHFASVFVTVTADLSFLGLREHAWTRSDLPMERSPEFASLYTVRSLKPWNFSFAAAMTIPMDCFPSFTGTRSASLMSARSSSVACVPLRDSARVPL